MMSASQRNALIAGPREYWRSNSNLPPLTHTADPYVSRSVTIWMFGDRRRPGLSVPFGALAEIDKPLCVPQRQGWHGMASLYYDSWLIKRAVDVPRHKAF